jgi:hypothetical protein
MLGRGLRLSGRNDDHRRAQDAFADDVTGLRRLRDAPGGDARRRRLRHGLVEVRIELLAFGVDLPYAVSLKRCGEGAFSHSDAGDEPADRLGVGGAIAGAF